MDHSQVAVRKSAYEPGYAQRSSANWRRGLLRIATAVVVAGIMIGQFVGSPAAAYEGGKAAAAETANQAAHAVVQAGLPWGEIAATIAAVALIFALLSLLLFRREIRQRFGHGVQQNSIYTSSAQLQNWFKRNHKAILFVSLALIASTAQAGTGGAAAAVMDVLPFVMAGGALAAMFLTSSGNPGSLRVFTAARRENQDVNLRALAKTVIEEMARASNGQYDSAKFARALAKVIPQGSLGTGGSVANQIVRLSPEQRTQFNQYLVNERQKAQFGSNRLAWTAGRRALYGIFGFATGRVTLNVEQPDTVVLDEEVTAENIQDSVNVIANAMRSISANGKVLVPVSEELKPALEAAVSQNANLAAAAKAGGVQYVVGNFYLDGQVFDVDAFAPAVGFENLRNSLFLLQGQCSISEHTWEQLQKRQAAILTLQEWLEGVFKAISMEKMEYNDWQDIESALHALIMA